MGERLCSFDQTHLGIWLAKVPHFSEEYVIPSPKLNEDQKLFRRN